jgi:hypothetical protein
MTTLEIILSITTAICLAYSVWADRKLRRAVKYLNETRDILLNSQSSMNEIYNHIYQTNLGIPEKGKICMAIRKCFKDLSIETKEV